MSPPPGRPASRSARSTVARPAASSRWSVVGERLLARRRTGRRSARSPPSTSGPCRRPGGRAARRRGSALSSTIRLLGRRGVAGRGCRTAGASAVAMRSAPAHVVAHRPVELRASRPRPASAGPSPASAGRSRRCPGRRRGTTGWRGRARGWTRRRPGVGGRRAGDHRGGVDLALRGLLARRPGSRRPAAAGSAAAAGAGRAARPRRRSRHPSRRRPGRRHHRRHRRARGAPGRVGVERAAPTRSGPARRSGSGERRDGDRRQPVTLGSGTPRSAWAMPVVPATAAAATSDGSSGRHERGTGRTHALSFATGSPCKRARSRSGHVQPRRPPRARRQS